MNSPFAPLRETAFRTIWGVSLCSAVAVYMNEVASAWLMLSLTPSPLWIALVQSAAMMPMLLLGMPAGAVADIIDRRRGFIATQVWGAVVAGVLFVLAAMGHMSPMLLLILVFANGMGVALRWPLFSASLPELVGHRNLAQGIALNGMAMTSSRIIGPIAGGLIIMLAGGIWVFAANFAVSVFTVFLVLRWRRDAPEKPSSETLGAALFAGLRYVTRTRFIQTKMARGFLLFFHFSVIPALLPLIANSLPGSGAGTYTALYACLGVGALASGVMTRRILESLQPDMLLILGVAMMAAAMGTVAVTQSFWLIAPAVTVVGACWMSVANSLAIAVQQAIPNWVRARGAAAFQVSIMGATAIGAATWGKLASVSDISTSLSTAAVSSVILILILMKAMPLDESTKVVER